MIPDTQKSKLLAAELNVESTLLTEDDARDLITEICMAHSLKPTVTFAYDGKLTVSRDELQVPRWARANLPIIHALAHLMTNPIFPPHGAEFAQNFLKLVFDFGPDTRLAMTLRDSYNDHGVHFTARQRQDRVRRLAVVIINKARGAEVELILDNPPRRIRGPLNDLRHNQLLEVGTSLYPLINARYLQEVRVG